MSWLGGYKSKTQKSESDDREAKRKKLEAERLQRIQRAQNRAETKRQILAGQRSQSQTEEAIKELLEIEPDILEGAEVSVADSEIDNLLSETVDQTSTSVRANTPPLNTPVEGANAEENQDILARATARMVNYDEATGTDDAGALQKAVTSLQNKAFTECDLSFYFNQVELKMRTAGVKKNFTKLLVLTSIIPESVIEETKHILCMQESDFGDEMPYLKLKKEILKIYRQAQETAFERAMGRVLSGRPSQLARALINDLCPKRLNGCCCQNFIVGLWKRQLSSGVKQQISHLEFNADNLEEILKRADEAFASNRPAVIPTAAAITTMPSGAQSLPGPPVLDEAFHPAFQDPQVAAMSTSRGRGRGRGRGGRQARGAQRGGRNQGQGSQGQGGQEHPRHKGPRHPDQPPISTCRRHWIFGKGAHFCEEPGSCPWKNFYVAKPNQ